MLREKDRRIAKFEKENGGLKSIFQTIIQTEHIIYTLFKVIKIIQNII